MAQLASVSERTLHFTFLQLWNQCTTNRCKYHKQKTDLTVQVFGCENYENDDTYGEVL